MTYWMFIAFENRAPPLKEFTPPMPTPKRAALIAAPDRVLDLFLDDDVSNRGSLNSDKIAFPEEIMQTLQHDKKPNLGRPKSTITADDIYKLKAHGLTLDAIAQHFKISTRTVQRIIKN